jgi:hypothetical protein
MHGISRSPYVLAGIAASLFIAVACSDDEDDGDDASNSGGGTSGSSGKGGSSGSSTGGSSGKGGTSTGGTSTGGTSTGGASGSAGTGATGGTAGTAGVSGDGGVGGDPSDGGMGGVGGTDGGMGGQGGDMTVYDVLDNPGFELGDVGPLNVIPGWQEGGDVDASYVEWTGGRTGHKLGHWRAWVMTTAETYTTSTFQRVAPIENGTYTFSMWVMRDQWHTAQYIFARGHNASVPAEELKTDTAPTMSNSAYVQVTLSNIQVTTNEVTVGIYSAAPGGVWANIDDASLTKNP